MYNIDTGLLFLPRRSGILIYKHIPHLLCVELHLIALQPYCQWMTLGRLSQDFIALGEDAYAIPQQLQLALVLLNQYNCIINNSRCL